MGEAVICIKPVVLYSPPEKNEHLLHPWLISHISEGAGSPAAHEWIPRTSINTELFLGATSQACGIEIRVRMRDRLTEMGSWLGWRWRHWSNACSSWEWECPAVTMSRGAVVALCHYCQANDSCMTMGHRGTHGARLHLVESAATRWALATPTSRTQSLTHSVGAHLSDL